MGRLSRIATAEPDLHLSLARCKTLPMRWIIVSAATVATGLGQDGNFSGSVFDPRTGRTQTINGSVEIQPKENPYLSTLRRINAEMAESNARLSAEISANDQLNELRRQSEALEKLAEGSGNSPRVAYAGATEPFDAAKFELQLRTQEAEKIAKKARNFDPSTKTPREGAVLVDLNSYSTDSGPNEQLIKSLLRQFKGDFTNYSWRVEAIDSQTFKVTCHVSLDGEKHDLMFKVNVEVDSCRYEGGTALAKLVPPSEERAPVREVVTTSSGRTITFLDDEESKDSGFDPSKPFTVESEPDVHRKSDSSQGTAQDELSPDLEFLDDYRGPETVAEKLEREKAIGIAKRAQNFSERGKQPIEGVVSAKLTDMTLDKKNEKLIEEAIKSYEGEFTGYQWRSSWIDPQTFLVTCEVALDGQKYEFKFQVNTALETCRYEGGTAFDKLQPSIQTASWWPW
jgi:hypothetical protein